MADDSGRAPRTFVVWSAVATVLCFFPFGIVALGYGLAAQRALERSELEVASRRGRVARRWLVATIAVGLVVNLILVAALVILGAFSH